MSWACCESQWCKYGKPEADGSRDPKPDKLAAAVDGVGDGWRMGLYERKTRGNARRAKDPNFLNALEVGKVR